MRNAYWLSDLICTHDNSMVIKYKHTHFTLKISKFIHKNLLSWSSATFSSWPCNWEIMYFCNHLTQMNFDQKSLCFLDGLLAYLGWEKGIFRIIFQIQNFVAIKIRGVVIVIWCCDFRILRLIRFLLLMLIKHLL